MFARLLLLALLLRPIAEISAQPFDAHDSLHLAHVLADALHYTARHRNGPFKITLQDSHPGDSSYAVTTKLRYGHLFSSHYFHLVVERFYSLNAQVDVYVYRNGHFHHLISDDGGAAELLDTKIKDFDGDGLKDLATHWYPLSGCCRRNVYQVYIYKPATGGFTSQYEFLNPTFYPAQKLIRGVLYGHPEETPLYKFRWNGLKLDTVEYIYHCVNKKGFVKTHKETLEPTAKSGIFLRSVPQEYLHITDYDWFIF